MGGPPVYIVRLVFPAAMVLAIGAMAVACGGGGSLSAEEYFEKLEAIGNEAQEKEDAALPSEEEAANPAPEEQKQTGIELLNSVAEINQDAFDKADGLNPPDDIRQTHDDLIAAGRDLVQKFQDLAGQAEDIPPEGIEDFFNSQVFVESTFAPLDEACFALQAMADDREIEVNLHCAPEE